MHVARKRDPRIPLGIMFLFAVGQLVYFAYVFG